MSLRSGPASDIRIDDMSRAIGQSGDYVWRPPAEPLSISERALTSPPNATAHQRPKHFQIAAKVNLEAYRWVLDFFLYTLDV